MRTPQPYRDEGSAVQGRVQRGRYEHRRDGAVLPLSSSPPRSPVSHQHQGVQKRMWRKKVSFVSPIATICTPRRQSLLTHPEGFPTPAVIDEILADAGGTSNISIIQGVEEEEHEEQQICVSFPSSHLVELQQPPIMATREAHELMAETELEGTSSQLISSIRETENDAMTTLEVARHVNSKHFEQPLSKEAMEVISMLVDKGSHLKFNKSKKVAPSEMATA
ncbi:uncharacterized protein LOC133911737 [Phragmites australis]|uniref:uncharacterized protein LOC133911737 n=1 Tax=Phragmites australis TaxID=29695 RepID=UPI002D76FDA0|nr:uncharacterized protein LOC133911737 [Phragmites australis]